MVWMRDVSDSFGRGALLLATACLLTFGCTKGDTSVVQPDTGSSLQDLAVTKDTPEAETCLDAASRPSDSTSFDNAGGDIVVVVTEPCFPSVDGPLAFESDPINLATQLVGKEHFYTSTLTNHGTRAVTVTGIALASTTNFRIVNPPSIPLTLAACKSVEITFEMFNEDALGRSVTHVTVSYMDEEGNSNSISTKVRGFMEKPESLTCKWLIAKLPDPYHTTGIEGNANMMIANWGTGACEILDIGVADCESDDFGVINCPAPEDATQSPRFKFTTSFTGLGVSHMDVYAGDSLHIEVHLTGGDNLPQKLPHYGMVFVRARQKLVGRISNFPNEWDYREETKTYPWHVVVAD